MHDDFYQMYLEEMKEMKPCTKEEKERLLAASGEERKQAEKRLVEGHLFQALEYAKEFDGQGVLLTDLVQEANMALMLAVEDYMSGEKADSFDQLVKERIYQALEECVEQEKAAGDTGEELAARANVLSKVSQMMAQELGREATVEELAEKMKKTKDEIRQIMKMVMEAVSVNAENLNLEDFANLSGLEELESLAGTKDTEE